MVAKGADDAAGLFVPFAQVRVDRPQGALVVGKGPVVDVVGEEREVDAFDVALDLLGGGPRCPGVVATVQVAVVVAWEQGVAHDSPHGDQPDAA